MQWGMPPLSNMLSNTQQALLEALTHKALFIQQMRKFSIKRLDTHLDLVREQMLMAYKNQQHKEYELLLEYESQIISAKFLKLEKDENLLKPK